MLPLAGAALRDPTFEAALLKTRRERRAAGSHGPGVSEELIISAPVELRPLNTVRRYGDKAPEYTLLVYELSSTRNAFKGLVTSILHEAVEHFHLL